MESVARAKEQLITLRVRSTILSGFYLKLANHKHTHVPISTQLSSCDQREGISGWNARIIVPKVVICGKR